MTGLTSSNHQLAKADQLAEADQQTEVVLPADADRQAEVVQRADADRRAEVVQPAEAAQPPEADHQVIILNWEKKCVHTRIHSCGHS